MTLAEFHEKHRIGELPKQRALRWPTRNEWRMFWQSLDTQKYLYRRNTLWLALRYWFAKEKWRQTRPNPYEYIWEAGVRRDADEGIPRN
jgi:hypothetical protein